MNNGIIVAFFIIILLSTSCKGDNKLTDQAEALITILDNQSDSEQGSYSTASRLVPLLIQLENHQKALQILNILRIRFPDGLYYSWYNYQSALIYESRGEIPFALIYFIKSVISGQNLIEKESENSIHFKSLQKISSLETDYEKKVWALQELRQRFPGQIDPGPYFLELGKTYDALSEWEKSREAYTNFLKFPVKKKSGTHGSKEEYQHIKERMDFHEASKSNTYESLDKLITVIKTAINKKDSYQLERAMSKDFFAMSWQQVKGEAFTQAKFQARDFMSSKVYYNNKIDPDSNKTEAYLKTSGWSWKIRTWYFYFKRVNYPDNPEINGRWIWAGIYLGEKN